MLGVLAGGGAGCAVRPAHAAGARAHAAGRTAGGAALRGHGGRLAQGLTVGVSYWMSVLAVVWSPVDHLVLLLWRVLFI